MVPTKGERAQAGQRDPVDPQQHGERPPAHVARDDDDSRERGDQRPRHRRDVFGGQAEPRDPERVDDRLERHLAPVTRHEREQDDQQDRPSEPDHEVEVDRRMVEVAQRDLVGQLPGRGGRGRKRRCARSTRRAARSGWRTGCPSRSRGTWRTPPAPTTDRAGASRARSARRLRRSSSAADTAHASDERQRLGFGGGGQAGQRAGEQPALLLQSEQAARGQRDHDPLGVDHREHDRAGEQAEEQDGAAGGLLAPPAGGQALRRARRRSRPPTPDTITPATVVDRICQCAIGTTNACDTSQTTIG